MIRIIDHEGNGYGAQAEITRRKGVNGEKSLTGVIYTNEEVLHGVDRGWKLEFENEMYAFTFAHPKDTGNRIELDFDAVHEFFYDMSKSAQNGLLNDGSHTFRTYLDFIFGGTRYNYRSDVNVRAFEKQNFGQKNRLELFYNIINAAGVEFNVNGSVVRILERVGNDLSTVVKKGFNLNELRLEKNIGDFVTYQKGFGAWNDEEDHSKGRLEVGYLSPLAKIYGKLDADPVVDERYTIRSNLLARLRNNVEGSYQISVQIDMEDLTRAGYEYKQPHEGDSIMAINDDLGFQRKVRIVSYETDFDIEGNILDHRITCNSIGMVEKSISNTNSIRYAINELQNDLELARRQITETRVSADGKSMNYFGPVEPTEDDYKLSIGDTWFDTSGEDTIIKVWNGVEWRNAGLDSEALRRQFDEVKRDIAEAQATAGDTAQQIDTAVSSLGFVDLPSALSSFDGQLVTHQETLDGMQSIVYDPDRGVASLNTQLSDLIQVAVTGEEMTGAISVLENNINARVEKGDVINQINISDENILIQANKIMALGDAVVGGKLTITDEFVAPNARINGAKIANATITHGKITSLDASKITTGKISGISIFMKHGEIGDWNLNSGVLHSRLRAGLNTTIKATGDVALAAGAPNPRDTTNATYQLWHSGRSRWVNTSGNTAGEIEVVGNRTYLDMYSGTFNRIRLPRSGFIGLAANGDLSIQNSGGFYINPGTNLYVVGDTRPSSSGNYHLGGANYRWKRVWTTSGVSESSDIRLKNNIADIPSKLLNGISQVEPRMYEMNGVTKFGYIAQDVERELFKYASKVVGSKQASEYIKQFDVLDKNDESHQALMYSQMEVAKGAYRDKKIEELENRIKELENAS